MISLVVESRLTHRAASEHYKILYSIIFTKYNGKNIKKQQLNQFITYVFEFCIMNSVAKYTKWRFPPTTLDLHTFPKYFLDRNCRLVRKFANCLPGAD